MNEIKTLSTWLSILGIPTIFALTSWCVRTCLKFMKDLEILHAAQKAQMRSQLLAQYYEIKTAVLFGPTNWMILSINTLPIMN